jgi:RNA polymerase primary sigma factor
MARTKKTQNPALTENGVKPNQEPAGSPRGANHTRTPKVPLPLTSEPFVPTADEELIEKDEPDVEVLVQTSEEWSDITLEDPIDILEDPSIALELSEDPVRLYLKEIGQIHLLDADSEFRLAARIEAERRIITLEKLAKPVYGHPNHYRSLFFGVMQDIVTAWARLQEDDKRIGNGTPPDLGLILSEAQMLRRLWQVEEPSYLRS